MRREKHDPDDVPVELVEEIRRLAEAGKGRQGIAEGVGLNRYACKVLVEKARAPTYRKGRGRKPKAGQGSRVRT
jgi:hypothetical protein